MLTTANYKLKKPEGTDVVDIKNFNDNADTIDAALSDFIYPVATGTATAITIPTQTLVNGYSKTFIASANNNGAATTINGKHLYKPGTTIAPHLVSGKAYTVWYNSTGGCFFIKASAEGNTIASHVLAGDTFSNDSDTGLPGSMANNGAVTITPGTTNKPITTGYHNGSGIVLGDADLISANIKAGANIFGVAGSGTVVDTSNAVLDPQYLLAGYSGYDDGTLRPGTMPNSSGTTIGGAEAGCFDSSAYLCSGSAANSCVGAFDIKIPKGYHDGISASRIHIPNLMPSNIISGVNVGWNTGYLTGTATIASLGGRRYATGTGTTTVHHNVYDGNVNSVCLNTLGLGFTPTILFCTFPNNTYLMYYKGTCITWGNGYSVGFRGLDDIYLYACTSGTFTFEATE